MINLKNNPMHRSSTSDMAITKASCQECGHSPSGGEASANRTQGTHFL